MDKSELMETRDMFLVQHRIYFDSVHPDQRPNRGRGKKAAESRSGRRSKVEERDVRGPDQIKVL